MAKPNNISDLIEGCKNGDVKCYEQVYRQFSKAMYHTSLRLVGCESDAEDILQESFFEAFSNLSKIKNADAFAGWLKKIVVNKSLNFLNRNKRQWSELNGEEEVDAEVFDEEGFENRIEEIKTALERIPPNQKLVISLHVFEDMGFEEIAVMMNAPSATVRSHYRRGRHAILQMIKK